MASEQYAVPEDEDPIEDNLTFENVGERGLKGVRDLWHLYRVVTG